MDMIFKLKFYHCQTIKLASFCVSLATNKIKGLMRVEYEICATEQT